MEWRRTRPLSPSHGQCAGEAPTAARWLAGAFFAVVVAPAPLAAMQVDTVLPEDPPAPYTIEVSPDIPLKGDWILGGASDLARMDDGRIIVVWSNFGDGFTVVSPDGSAARRVGRRGEGPGDYGYVRWVRPHRDRLHLFDAMLQRRTVLDGAYKVVHTNPVCANVAFDAVVLGDSAYVINASIPTPERVGYALHLFDESGSVVRPFDELPEGYGTPGSEMRLYRSLAVARDRKLWSAHFAQYRID